MTSQINACQSRPFPALVEDIDDQLTRTQVRLMRRHRTCLAFDDDCKGNLTNLRRELHSSLAKGNPKRTL
jgi:hypothetical protein